VDVSRRNQCQACRFNKCLEANMRREGMFKHFFKVIISSTDKNSLRKKSYKDFKMHWKKHTSDWHSYSISQFIFSSLLYVSFPTLNNGLRCAIKCWIIFTLNGIEIFKCHDSICFYCDVQHKHASSICYYDYGYQVLHLLLLVL
jgi:hypothetical protein